MTISIEVRAPNPEIMLRSAHEGHTKSRLLYRVEIVHSAASRQLPRQLISTISCFGGPSCPRAAPRTLAPCLGVFTRCRSLRIAPLSVTVHHSFPTRGSSQKDMLIRRLAKVCARFKAPRADSHCRCPRMTKISCQSRRYSSISRMEELITPESTTSFCLNDYDCVGFDLDNTILKYNVPNLIKLEYEALSRFLVEKKGYDPSYLLKPLDVDFLQKGLALDYENGNVLQLAPDGSINRASHGTKMLNRSSVEELYGKERMSSTTREYTQNMLNTWNGPISEKIRCVMDYFDVPAALAFARCVDCIDDNAETEKSEKSYNLYHDITQGLISMYQRDNFANNAGAFFPAVKENPESYMYRCSPHVVKWLKELKNQKKVFLVTGSNADFASFTAQFCLGDGWQNLFDVVICFARKPGFFTGRRPFISCVNGKEKDLVESEKLKFGQLYSQGNWQDLYELFKKETVSKQPKCLYVGDNIVQDVFAPDEYTRCDAIAISEEMISEGVEDEKCVGVRVSNTWGSYFYHEEGKPSLWCDMIRRHSAICVPGVDVLAKKPLDYQFRSFRSTDQGSLQDSGFHPKAPSK